MRARTTRDPQVRQGQPSQLLQAQAQAEPGPNLQGTLGNRVVARMLVQREAAGGAEPAGDTVHRAAAGGLRTPAGRLPHLGALQRSFGRHSLRGVQAHLGSGASFSARMMSAAAYTAGQHIVFGDTPDLRTAAHEAAHVIQQRSGLRLGGGLGVRGDVHERHADEVAARVVAGRSAEDLLDRYPARTSPEPPVQRQIQLQSINTEGYTNMLTGADFRSDHLATTKDDAESASLARARGGRGLINTVIDSSEANVKSLVKAADYTDDTAHIGGDQWRVKITASYWTVTMRESADDKQISRTDKTDDGTVWVKVYFNAKPDARITGVHSAG